MSASSARRSTAGSSDRCSIPSAASATSSACMTRILPSTSLRLALGYAGLFIVSSLLLVGLLWWRTAAYLDREIDAVILADTQAIADRFRDFGLNGAIQAVSE